MLWLPGSVQMMLASSPREADDESHRSPAKNLGIGIPAAGQFHAPRRLPKKSFLILDLECVKLCSK